MVLLNMKSGGCISALVEHERKPRISNQALIKMTAYYSSVFIIVNVTTVIITITFSCLQRLTNGEPLRAWLLGDCSTFPGRNSMFLQYHVFLTFIQSYIPRDSDARNHGV